jgi:hypothetical protein
MIAIPNGSPRIAATSRSRPTDARDIYAVALDPARGDVDEGGTAKLRS